MCGSGLIKKWGRMFRRMSRGSERVCEGVTQLVVTLIRGGHGEHIGQQLQHRQSCMPSLIGGEWVEAGKLLNHKALEKLLQI